MSTMILLEGRQKDAKSHISLELSAPPGNPCPCLNFWLNVTWILKFVPAIVDDWKNPNHDDPFART